MMVFLLLFTHFVVQLLRLMKLNIPKNVHKLDKKNKLLNCGLAINVNKEGTIVYLCIYF